MSGYVAVRSRSRYRRVASGRQVGWVRAYTRRALVGDFCCGVFGVFAAAQLRFDGAVSSLYGFTSLALPLIWVVFVGLAGGYDVRFIGIGSDEFRKILNAGVSLIAVVAIFSYAVNSELSRGYLLIALPCVTIFNLVARYAMRKRLHRVRTYGRCMHSVV